ncbi:cupin domain-containing protein [Bacillus sp. 03113]|uniref:cupin domain-containing protein n=1 Tax=Bacillus sp. 03113 TaxID=2578211 RepID=UPI001141D2FA|nr:cupin domain-containing protein [Bacillus sp. 03113]
MSIQDPQYFITSLGLEPHPEGGYFRRTYESDLVGSFKGKRKLYTSIYFLLKSHDISHFHRLQSDELWYYHAGSPLTIHLIHPDGQYEEINLGIHLDQGEAPQILVPKGCIFGSTVVKEHTFSLVGCMVSPGFEYEDFELFAQEDLLKMYPQHEEIIKKMAYKQLPE